MNKVHQLRFWCQKVLPLVYDDSLSYYELLCKVVNYLNELVKNINEIPDYIDEVIEDRLSDDKLRELISAIFDDIKKSISENDETGHTNASKNYSKSDLIWFDNVLYICTKDIPHGNLFIFTGEDINVTTITIEERTANVYNEANSSLTIHAKVE